MRMSEVTEAKNGYQAFELDGASRSRLAQQFPPKFSEFIGHHITHKFGVWSTEPLPDDADIKVVGYAVDPEGIEALVISVNGTTTRPDGKTYHCTWSLDRDKGFKPVNSNSLIEKSGYERLSSAINIHAKPKFIAR